MGWFATTALVLATLGTGVMAGVFFAFSSFVMRALDLLSGADAARAMRSMNLTAVRAPLMLALFGTMFIALVCTGLGLFGAISAPASTWIYAATAVQLVGSVVVTGAANVPRNDRLAGAADDEASLEAAWRSFRRGWPPWNHLRTAACVLSCIGFAVALALS